LFVHSCACSQSLCIDCAVIVCLQLHARFDHLKRQHADEKKKIEDSRKRLEDEMNVFQQRKAAMEAQTSTMGKKKK
jgi:septin 6/8/11